MSDPLGRDHMLRVIEDAFKPCWCVTQLQRGSYGELFGFRVFDTRDQPVATYGKLKVEDYRKEEVLFALISDARETVKAMGVELEAWSFRKAVTR